MLLLFIAPLLLCSPSYPSSACFFPALTLPSKARASTAPLKLLQVEGGLCREASNLGLLAREARLLVSKPNGEATGKAEGEQGSAEPSSPEVLRVCHGVKLYA